MGKIKSSILTIFNKLYNSGNIKEMLKVATDALFEQPDSRRGQLFAKLDAFDKAFKTLALSGAPEQLFFAGGHSAFFVLLRQLKSVTIETTQCINSTVLAPEELWALSERYKIVTDEAFRLAVEIYTNATYDSTSAGVELRASIEEELPGLFSSRRGLRNAVLDAIDSTDPSDSYRFSALFTRGARAIMEFTPEQLKVGGAYSRQLVAELLTDATGSLPVLFGYCPDRDHLLGQVVIRLGSAVVGSTHVKPVGDDSAEGREEREAAIAEIVEGLIRFEAEGHVKAYTGINPGVAELILIITGPQRPGRWVTKTLAERAAELDLVLLQDPELLNAFHELADPDKKILCYYVRRIDGVATVTREKAGHLPDLLPIAFSVAGSQTGQPSQVTPRKNITRIALAVESDGTAINTLRELRKRLSNHKGARGYATFAGEPPELRFLKPRSSGPKPEKPAKIATYDIETVTAENGELLPYMIGIYYTTRRRKRKNSTGAGDETKIKEHFAQFYTAAPQLATERERICDQAVEFIAANLQGYKLFAHRAFHFDFLLIARALLDNLTNRVFDAGGDVNDVNEYITFKRNREGLISVKVQFDQNVKSTVFLDSYNFIKMPLNSAGITFVGSTKTELPQGVNIARCTEKMLKDPATLAQLKQYNEQDCRLLYQILKVYEKEIFYLSGLNAFKSSTQTGLSYRIFLRLSQGLENSKVVVPDRATASLIRAALRGGRTEVLHHYAKAEGSKKLYFLDFTSLYPATAYFFPQPTGYMTRLRPATVKSEAFKDKLGIYYCHVTTPNKQNQYPFLPVRYGQEVVVPEGEFYSTYTSAEVDYARAIGYTVRIIDGVYFSDRSFVLDEYIEKIYREKLLAEKKGPEGSGRRAVAKLLLNGLLGRFAQRQDNPQARVESISHVTDNPGREIDEIVEVGPDTAVVSFSETPRKIPVLTVEGTRAEIAPQITAFVTARARIMLHQAMTAIQATWGATIHYVDTDSIAFSTEQPFDLSELTRVLAPSTNPENKLGCPGMGELVPVYKTETITEMQFIAPKVYRITTDKNVYTKTAGFVPDVGQVEDSGAAWGKLMSALLERTEVTAKEVELLSKGGIRKEAKSFGVRAYSGRKINLLPHLLAPSRRVLQYDKKGSYLGTAPVALTMKKGYGEAYRKELMSPDPIPTEWFTRSESVAVVAPAKKTTLGATARIIGRTKRDFSTKAGRKIIAEERLRVQEEEQLKSIEGCRWVDLVTKDLDRQEGKLRIAREEAIDALIRAQRKKVYSSVENEEKQLVVMEAVKGVTYFTRELGKITATEVLPLVLLLRAVEVLRNEHRKVKYRKPRPEVITVKLYLPIDEDTRNVGITQLEGWLDTLPEAVNAKSYVVSEGARLIWEATVPEAFVAKLITCARETYRQRVKYGPLQFTEGWVQPPKE